MYEQSRTGPVSPQPGDAKRGRDSRAAGVGWVQAMWAGEVPLARVFWEYAIVYGTALNFLLTIAALAVFSTGGSTVFALVLHFLPLPYNVLMLVGVWRSAGRYRGNKTWADLARGAMIVWVIVATAAI